MTRTFSLGLMSWALAAFAAALLCAFALGAKPAEAVHAWDGYHWARSANPFTVELGDNVDANYDSELSQASNDWSASAVLDAPLVAGSGTNCPFVSGTDQVCNGAYGQTGWLGLATISISSSGHIVAAKAQMNDSYLLGGGTYDTVAWRDFVTCQEVGHGFGLDHQDEVFTNRNLGTCMDYTVAPQGGTRGRYHRYGPANLQPNQGDYDELLCIYDPAYFGQTLSTDTHTCVGTGHLDGGGPGRVAHQVDVTDPQERGRLVAEDASSKVFVRDFDDGTSVVTYIDLVPTEDQ